MGPVRAATLHNPRDNNHQTCSTPGPWTCPQSYNRVFQQLQMQDRTTRRKVQTIRREQEAEEEWGGRREKERNRERETASEHNHLGRDRKEKERQESEMSLEEWAKF